MIFAKASTPCLSDPEAFGYLVGADTNDQVRLAFQRAFASYATGDTKNPFDARLRAAKAQSVAFANALDVIARNDLVNGDKGNTSPDTGDGGYPSSSLGHALSDRVLIMTTSEFGRTLRDNGSGGLDHGAASVGMLFGPARAGLYGEFPSLTKLSENDEPIATVSFDQYYATVAQSWFGVPAGDMLHGNVSPIADVFV